jgi:exosortase/archaeosortase family protein
MIAGHLFLQSNWRKAMFSLLTVPVVIFKNAVRIVTISCLGIYVDPGFLHGRLHRYGGLPFSLLSLAILAPLLFALQKKDSQPTISTLSPSCVSTARSLLGYPAELEKQ